MADISVIVTTRNDNHGGNLINQLNLFVDTLVAQAKRYNLRGELIIVDWNSEDTDNIPLQEKITWPVRADNFDIRIIKVPPKLHNILFASDKMSMYQMIAKNVGAGRAKHEYILFTNPDIIFPNSLIEKLSKESLVPQKIYRAVRHDINADINLSQSIDARLALCAQSVYEKHAQRGNSGGSFPNLFTNGCGDFTLLHRDACFKATGYLEIAAFSLHLDSQMYARLIRDHGCKEFVFEDPICHMQHDGGLLKNSGEKRENVARWVAKGFPVIDSTGKMSEIIHQSNNIGWGHRYEHLQEVSPYDNNKTKNAKHPKSIAFILTGGIGDILEGIPTARALQRKYPRAKLTWVVDTIYAELIPKDINKIIISGVSVRAPNARRKIEVWVDTNNKHYDRIYVPMGVMHYAQSTIYRQHMMDCIAAWCDVKLSKRKISVPQLQDVDISTLNLPEDYIAVCSGPCYSCKNWSYDERTKLIKYLLYRGHHVVLVGGSDGRGRIVDGLTNVYDLSGQLSLLQSAKVIEGASLYVGPDNGTTWLSCITDTPKLCVVSESRAQIPVGFEGYAAGRIADVYYNTDTEYVKAQIDRLLAPAPKRVLSRKRKPSITVGLIVLNGGVWLQAWWDTYKDFADQIVAVEGVDAEYFARLSPQLRNEIVTQDGHSTDNTMELLEKFVNEQRVDFTLVGRKKAWPSKNDMVVELSKHVECDYLFEIDGDEFWHKKDLEQIRDILNDRPSVGVWHAKPINFWKSGDYHTMPLVSKKTWWSDGPVLFKWKNGATLYHRPRHVEPQFGRREEYLPFKFHHYNYVLDQDAKYKAEYHRHPCVGGNWYELIWKPWTPQNRIDKKRGIQVEYCHKTEVTEFTGKHPEHVAKVLLKLQADGKIF